MFLSNLIIRTSCEELAMGNNPGRDYTVRILRFTEQANVPQNLVVIFFCRIIYTNLIFVVLG